MALKNKEKENAEAGPQPEVPLRELYKKTFGMEPGSFEPLKADPQLFRSVRVDERLGTIVWPNGADMDPDVLYGAHIPAWMEEDERVAA